MVVWPGCWCGTSGFLFPARPGCGLDGAEGRGRDDKGVTVSRRAQCDRPVSLFVPRKAAAMALGLFRVCLVVVTAIVNHPLLFPRENATVPENEEEIIRQWQSTVHNAAKNLT